MYDTRHTLALMSCCAALHGVLLRTVPTASSPALRETSALLHDIRRGADASRTTRSSIYAICDALRAVDQFKSFNRLSDPDAVMLPRSLNGAQPCDDSAVLYLSTGSYLLFNDYGNDACAFLPGLALEVAGNAGSQQFVFASGTPIDIVIASINTFTSETGVSGAVAAANEDRVELRSVEEGEAQFVSVTMLDAEQACFPLICTEPIGGPCNYSAIDFGVAGVAGDVTCDQQVDIADLMFVLSNWGACPSQPASCPGDANLDGVVDVSDLLLVFGNWSR